MGLYLAVIGSVGRQGLVLSFKPMTAAPLLGMGQGYLFSDGGVIKPKKHRNKRGKKKKTQLTATVLEETQTQREEQQEQQIGGSQENQGGNGHCHGRRFYL